LLRPFGRLEEACPGPAAELGEDFPERRDACTLGVRGRQPDRKVEADEDTTAVCLLRERPEQRRHLAHALRRCGAPSPAAMGACDPAALWLGAPVRMGDE